MPNLLALALVCSGPAPIRRSLRPPDVDRRPSRPCWPTRSRGPSRRSWRSRGTRPRIEETHGRPGPQPDAGPCRPASRSSPAELQRPERRRDDLVRLRLGRGDRRRGRDPHRLPRRQGAQRLEVRAAGRQAFEAEIIAADPRSDLAVIVPREGPGIPPPKLKPIALGDASTAPQGIVPGRAGQPVQRGAGRQALGELGHPGERRPAARTVDRRSQQPPSSQLRNYPTLLQLDSKLNLGMSGGAVDQPQGRAGRPDDHRRQRRGFDARPATRSRWTRSAAGSSRRSSKARRYEYGFLGISLDPNGHEPGR